MQTRRARFLLKNRMAAVRLTLVAVEPETVQTAGEAWAWAIIPVRLRGVK
jgi:hypothetical protein